VVTKIKKKIIFLAGPTAIGKSEFALKICENLPVEIINVDSVQVFKEMDIGSAKPTKKSLSNCRHHLIDIINPNEKYSLGRFLFDFDFALKEIQKKNKIPLVSGGTMMYLHSLFFGVSDLPESNQQIFSNLNDLKIKYGIKYLHKKLNEIDPVLGLKLNENDQQRIIRSLEIYEITKIKPSLLFKNKSSLINDKFETLNLFLTTQNRKLIHEKIQNRFLKMIELGLVDEVVYIKKKYSLDRNSQSLRAVGYKQINKYLENEYSLEEAIYKSIVATRQLAKRQFTWMNKFDFFEKNYIENTASKKNIYEKIENFISI
jgi:tRNA dimethylallyltransferase